MMNRKLTIIGILLVAAAAGIVFWFVTRDGERQQGGPARSELSESEMSELIRTNNRAIAFLENEQTAQCEPLFSRILQQIPSELSATQNLAVSRVLEVAAISRHNEPDKFRAAAKRAQEILNRLRTLDPESAVAHFLAAKLAVSVGDNQAAVRELQNAARKSPQDAGIWYELFSVARYLTDDKSQQIAQEAITRAWELAPDNVWVLLDWLTSQARSKNEQLLSGLQQARSLLESFSEGVRLRTRRDLSEVIAVAQAAAEEKEWQRAQAMVSRLGIWVRPDSAAQSDRLRIVIHPLELVVSRLSFETPERIAAANADAPPPIKVTWKRESSHAFPEYHDVRDAALGDFNLDGQIDLCLLRARRVTLLGRSSPEADWAVLAETDLPQDVQRVQAADLDHDDLSGQLAEGLPRKAPPTRHTSDLDLVLSGAEGVLFLRNEFSPSEGQIKMELVKPLEALASLRDITHLCVADINSDGDLDLVTVTPQGLSLWANRGGFLFSPLGTFQDLPREVSAVSALDWDRDIDLDLLLSSQGCPLGYLENLRHDTFQFRAYDLDPPFTAQAIAVLEADGNRSWDAALVGQSGAKLLRTRTPEPGKVVPIDWSTLDEHPLSGVATFDFDNDGYRDLLIWNRNRIEIMRGLPRGEFSKPFPLDGWEEPLSSIQNCAFDDVDQDGDIDLLVVGDETCQLLLNQGGHQNSWVSIGLVALQLKERQSSVSGRVNHYGLGSRLELISGSRYQALVADRPWNHFGLGSTQQADALRMVWPNGIPDNVVAPPRNTVLFERQTLKGSCPYLYTWNGQRFVFVTDLLWAAPIGLSNPQGTLVPCREWEYLKVPGRYLVPRDGEYRIAITEELWEAAYFDQVELIAVDHPEDVEIFSNEKVGPASMAEYHIHTVSRPRKPVSAHNQSGRDLLPMLSERDDRYAKVFDKKYRQGYTEDSYIELDLGLSSVPERLTLFLTGWVYPTDTTINKALSEDPAWPGPRPPWISVPDANGQFREVLPFMGFPGGKTKTIAVDLSGIFLTSDTRLRINTSMELYWDAIFFTADEEPVSVKQQNLELLSAELHFRGLSARIEHPRFGPERYDYDMVRSERFWPAMAGRFTRYGDVSELLREPDARSVVLGSGDEMILRFRAPDPPPKGWTRDFILHNVGWDKDADLHTVCGQTVEPLPFPGMRAYPYFPEQSFPDTPLHQEYLRRYQTRELDSGKTEGNSRR